MSSDVTTGAALGRLHDFAKERSLRLVPWRPLSNEEKQHHVGKEGGVGKDEKAHASVHSAHADKHAQVFAGWRSAGSAERSHVEKRSEMALPETAESGNTPSPDIFIVYCPLLRNAVQPDFDPVVSQNGMTRLRPEEG